MLRTGWSAALCAAALMMGAAAARAPKPETPGPALKAFADEAEFERFISKLRAEAESSARRQLQFAAPAPASLSVPPPAPPAPSAAPTLDRIQLTGSRIAGAEESITNVQTQGVDEGDIVKRQGDHLIVLRRGRLFTVRIGADGLQPVAVVDAFGPGMDPSGAWYDEMLVSEGTVVVIGFSYARGGTEIGVFDLDARGGLAHRDTYHLRSNDYYSSRNYASRLIGRELVFYTPHRLDPQSGDAIARLPALRRWGGGDTRAAFRRILPATRIHRAPVLAAGGEDLMLHTVTRCDLDAPVLSCTATAALGPEGRVFYVAEDAVYVWTTPWEVTGPDQSTVFRLPLDGQAPRALRVSGGPVDQLGLLQRDGHLHALVGSETEGEAMWNSTRRAGHLALLRVPLAAFGDGTGVAPASAYRSLPGIGEDTHNLQNRFIGDWLVYGRAPARWRREATADTAYAVRYAQHGPVQTLRLAHEVERIDALGTDAVIVGSRGPDLMFTSVELGERAAASSVYTQPDARQGDARTHGFFYRSTDADAGIVGLPVLGRSAGVDSASVLYLDNRALRLSRLGALHASAGSARDDRCRASCVDWYGNARPIFIGERVFALLGYELVEGRVDARRIVERRRVDFGPTR